MPLKNMQIIQKPLALTLKKLDTFFQAKRNINNIVRNPAFLVFMSINIPFVCLDIKT